MVVPEPEHSCGASDNMGHGLGHGPRGTVAAVCRRESLGGSPSGVITIHLRTWLPFRTATAE
jgi:hypothetical protein